VPPPTVTTAVLDESPTGHCTEFLYDDGVTDDCVVCAAHGGGVEPGTAEQAIELATRIGATCWARLGYDDEAFETYHPPSTAIDTADHPLLDSIADRGFSTVLSLHGLADAGVLVGGGVDPGTRRAVARRLDGAVSPAVEVVSTGQYAGVDPDNFVNWLGDGGGIQIEQGPAVRDDERMAVVATLEGLVADGTV
jgi:phage replication-related protein YjqB (UPF0714/DUF867 family)